MYNDNDLGKNSSYPHIYLYLVKRKLAALFICLMAKPAAISKSLNQKQTESVEI
jgi:hypothetical protein